MRSVPCTTSHRVPAAPPPRRGRRYPPSRNGPSCPTRPGPPLAGTQISIIGEYPEELWAAELQRFMDVTGIDVRFGPLDGGSDRSGVPPDLAVNRPLGTQWPTPRPDGSWT